MSRDAYTSADVSTVAPGDFLDQYAGHIKKFYDASCLRLTGVTGTDDIEATATPDFDTDGLVAGMRFVFVAGAGNTGPVTLAINGGSQVDVLDAEGIALPSGRFSAGMVVQVYYDGADFRVISSGGTSSGALHGWWVFEASGAWTKPDWLSDDAPLTVEAWGAGGGGSTGASGGGGGGGAYMRHTFRGEDVPSSVTVTIGAGGAAGSTGGTGGNTTFGALLTAYGGGPGTSVLGGGGAGSHDAGTSGADGGGYLGGGRGGFVSDTTAQAAGDASSLWAGGGGALAALNGGRAVYGGAGGGGPTGDGGVSIWGGNGGDAGVAGTVPSGGGGHNAPGANGLLIVYTG